MSTTLSEIKTGPSTFAKAAAYFFLFIFALVCVTGLYGAAGFAVMIMLAVIGGPIMVVVIMNRKPFPVSESPFTDEELGLTETEDVEPVGGRPSMLGCGCSDATSGNLSNPFYS